MNSSPSISINGFYLLEDPLGSRALRLENHEKISVEEAWDLFRGRKKPATPIILQGYMGNQLFDILWSGLVRIICISDKVENFLKENNTSGWATYPVEVYDRKGTQIHGYHGFAITGKQCRRDYDRSTLYTIPNYPGWGPRQVNKGIYFYPEDWDGSDFFLVWPGVEVVTEKVRSLFKLNKIANIRFTQLPEADTHIFADAQDKAKPFQDY